MTQYFDYLKRNLKEGLKVHPVLLGLIIILLVIGIFFRFVNLDRKAYWGDEVFTSLQLSGYTRLDMSQQLYDGRVISVKDLQKYQHPSSEKSLLDTIKSLAADDPQHPPLYSVIHWFWIHLFGSSVAGIRSFSAFLSLVAFPCLYWLSQELFKSPLISWTAVALMAISPFHVLYAQEARPYSLYIITILLSSTLLLRALRVKTNVSWSIYMVTVTLGLYTHVLFALVTIGHGIYIVAIERFRLTRSLTSYVLASLAGFLTFVPWIVVVLSARTKFEATSWANTKSSFFSSLTRWIGIFSRAFLDLGIGPEDSLNTQLVLIPFILILISVITYSFYFLYRRTSQQIWLFIFTLIGVTGIAFVLPDFVLGRRYATTRFMTPCILGIQLSVAYLLAIQTSVLSPNNLRQNFWQFVTAILISSGVISCAISSQAEIWWNTGKEESKSNSQIAYIVNHASQPLLISDADSIQIQTLGYLLDPKVKLQLVNQNNIPEIPNGFSDVFLLKPSESLRSGLERKYNAKVKMINKVLEQLEIANK